MCKATQGAKLAASIARLSGSFFASYAFTAVLAVIVVASGCGSRVRRVHVSGNVVFDGKAIEEGSIAFAPVKGTSGPTTGGVIRGGRYDVAAAVGPLAGGTYRVQIESLVYQGRSARDPFNPNGPPLKLPDNTVPPKYNAESVLKVTFATDAKEQREDFELKSNASQ